MTTTSTTPVDGFAARLRTETWPAHQEAERAPFIQDLLAGRLPVGEYTRLVAQHHALYGVLEAAVSANGDPELAPFFAPELARMPALVADLEFLSGAKVAVLDATRAYCAHMLGVSTTWPAGLLAHHYVRYLGDLSGGQLVGRVLQRVYGFEDGRGIAFYRFPDVPSAKAFKVQYRAQLDALPWDESTRQRFVDEANLAFRLNLAIFDALASTRTSMS